MREQREEHQTMPRKAGVSTVKKNIERESIHYFVRHKTNRFIQKLAEKDERPVGSYLDVLAEREARRLLPAEVVDEIIAEGEREEAKRRQEAERELARVTQERETTQTASKAS
jgi:hypothetical protein